MGAAEQVVRAEPTALQQIESARRVLGIAVVRGADQRQIGRSQPEGRLATCEKERKGLERLGRRTQVGGNLGIALVGDQIALWGPWSDGRDRPEVPGLRQAAAEDGGDPGKQRRPIP